MLSIEEEGVIMKKVPTITLLILTCIAIAIGFWFGFFEIYDCPTCLAIIPFVYGMYALPVFLLLLLIVLVIRFLVLKKHEVKAKQVFSDIISAMLLNMLTNPIAFFIGCWIGMMCNPYNWHNWH